MVVSQPELLRELSEHNDYFDMLVDMIPSKLYIAGNSGDDYNPKNRFLQKGPSESSKEGRRAAAKQAKRRKLNPSQAESTVEVKARLESEKEDSVQRPTKASDTEKAQQDTTTLSPNQSRIEALRAKLQAKIAAHSNTKARTPDQISKRAARRAEKRRRQQVAQQKAASSKVDGRGGKQYQLSTSTATTSDDPAKDLMAVDFSRLTGLNNNGKDNYHQTNKALANLNKSKSLERILADAEAKRQKLQQLQQGSEQEKQKAESMQWTDTFKEANGQRVKEDPTKLKKALKRKAAKKQKSSKAWKTRLQQTAAKQQEKQSIRQHNLQARKQGGSVGAHLSKKRIVTNDEPRKRLSRAGFEGRKQDFLNGSGGKKSGGGGASTPRD